MRAATERELRVYLATVPAAQERWAECFHAMGMSMEVVRRVVETMQSDAASPLREAEDGLLAAEVARVQREQGGPTAATANLGKTVVRVSAVLSTSDQRRLTQLVGKFCQPVFRPTGRFVTNGHVVANAVRRCSTSYIFSKIPKGAQILEVGPDERHWLLAAGEELWDAAKQGKYRGARPILGPRDAVRAGWKSLARCIAINRGGGWSADQQERAQVMLTEISRYFPRVKVQDYKGQSDYVVSADANYDIGFHDMPDVLAATGARAWMGYMNRAKGLTRVSKRVEGQLELLGAAYRVDWERDVVRFSQRDCPSFGYTHKLSAYMEYEENNGYVWNAHGCHYVYCKLPETNAEVLFFSVVRVPAVVGIKEPRYVEELHSGELRLTSVWAVGDEYSGVPNRFERVVFHCDKLNFSKVLERRRTLQHKGTLASTLTLVRSTNVRFWLNGVPVSAQERIAGRLSEAAAVLIEVLAAKGRLNTDMVFSKAMSQHRISVATDGWFLRCLEDVFNLRAVVGKVTRPVCELWGTLRAALADLALSPLVDLDVGVEEVPMHRALGVIDSSAVRGPVVTRVDLGSCVCSRLADARAALHVLGDRDSQELQAWVAELEAGLPCVVCTAQADAMLAAAAAEVGEETADPSGGSESEGSAGAEDSRVWSDSGSGSDTELTDASSDGGGSGASWRDEGYSTVESAAMRECVELEEHLIVCQMSEARDDATRAMAVEPPTEASLAALSTSRVRHAAMRFESGRCVRTVAGDNLGYGAVYDARNDAIVPLTKRGTVQVARVPDGWHYTCSRLRVWNSPQIIGSLECALSYGRVRQHRASLRVLLGVPGAGKTRALVKRIADGWREASWQDLVLCVTNRAVAQARSYAVQFGLPAKFVEERFMTLDRFLMYHRLRARNLYVDEFAMVHIGRVDGAIVLSRPQNVLLTGDAEQIRYDPFTPTFSMVHARLGLSVPEENVTFMPESHRLNEDVCAAFVDRYPAIYPCNCCRVGERQRKTLSWRRVTTLGSFAAEAGVRDHVYKQDEMEEVRVALNHRGTPEELRAMVDGGISSVGEDQGATHRRVRTFRVNATYDKATKVKKQTLYNRVEFVLTDMTRHTHEYEYNTMCEEEDEVIRRIKLSRDPERLLAVRERRGIGDVTLQSLLM